MKTASAIILAGGNGERLRTVAPGGAGAILPSDHYVDDAAAFMARVEGVPSTLPPGKAKPPASRTRASSPLISRAMSWSGVPSGSRCFRSPGLPRRTWATPRARVTRARVRRQLRLRRTGDHSISLRLPASGDPEDRTRAAASAS